MRAVISVVGKDQTGILAKVSNHCYLSDVNIVDVTQTIMDNLFVMVMLVEIDKLNRDYQQFVQELQTIGDNTNLKIHVMHEDIFNSMHRI